MIKNYIFCFILINFILHLESKIIVKSSNTFPHRSDENYTIEFKTLPTYTKLLITILDGKNIVEQNEVNKKIQDIKNTVYFEYIKLNFKNNTVNLKFKQKCDAKKLVIYEKSKASNYETRIYRKLVDLIILANLTFTTRDVIVKEKRFIEYKCSSKSGNYLSIPTIKNLNNLTVISKNSSINPNEISVVLLVNEKDDGYNIECSDVSGAKTNITIRYDGHPNEVDVLPKYKYNLSLNTSLECVTYPDEIYASLIISWTVKTWDNKIFEYSNNSLDLDQVNKLSKCNHFTVTCHVQSNVSGIVKLLSKQIQLMITYSNEEIDERMYFTMKEMCEMKIRLKNLEIQNKEKENKEMKNEMKRKIKDLENRTTEIEKLIYKTMSTTAFIVDNFKNKAESINKDMEKFNVFEKTLYIKSYLFQFRIIIQRDDQNGKKYRVFLSHIILPGISDKDLIWPPKLTCILYVKNISWKIGSYSKLKKLEIDLFNRMVINEYETSYLQNGFFIMELSC